MTTKLGTPIADFETQLATQIDPGDTTATLQSATDDDSVALPAGRYFFTLDMGNSVKEHISCDLSGTALTNIKSVSRQGVETTGAARTHRIGASVTITDYAHIKYMNDLLKGTTGFNSSVKLGYDGNPGLTSADLDYLATVRFVVDTAAAGAGDASNLAKGVTFLSVVPNSPTTPIAVGDNDPRVPSQGENDAMVGSSGTPSSSNKYITEADVSAAAAADKIVRATGTALPALDASNLLNTAIKQSFTADAPITVRDVLCISSGGNANTYAPQAADTSSTGSIVANGGGGGTAKWAAQTFVVPSETNLYMYTATLKTNQSAGAGSLTTTLHCTIRATSGGAPTGADLATASTVSNSIGGQITFTFPTPVVLTAGVTYALIIWGNAMGSDANWTFYGNYTSTDSGANWSISSGTTQNTTLVYGKTTTAGRVIPAKALENNVLANGYLGFAGSTVAEGESVLVTMYGIITGLSGLTVGSTYYISDTKGQIGSSAGSQSRKVGMAISTTSLLIKHDNL